jgi:hypothetical protein
MPSSEVHFRGPYGTTQTYRVPTTAIAAVLIRAWSNADRWVLTFRGTPAELIAAGVADELMLDFRGRKHERAGHDEFGDKFQIKRRGRGQVDLVRWFEEEIRDPAIIDEYQPVVRAVLTRWT